MPEIIGFDGHVLTGRFQGTRTTLSNLLIALAKRIGDKEVIVYTDDPQAAKELLDVSRYRYKPLGGAGSIRRLLSAFPKLFKRDGVTIGVFQYMTPLWGRNVVFIHDILPITHPHLFPLTMRLRTKLFFSLAIWRSELVFVVSNYTKSEIQRIYGIGDNRLKVVRNGPSFPLSAYSSETTDDTVGSSGERFILTVGRIEPRKNIPLLVDAFRKSGVTDVRLIIVGAFDLGFKFRVPAGVKVEIKAGVSEFDLIRLYKTASLFIFPSEAEGFGVPLLDATLFGLPVISSNKTAMPEVGLDLVEYFDPTAPDAVDTLARQIEGHFGERPISRPSREMRVAQAARFSWDRAAESFVSAIEQIIETGAKHRRH